MTKPPIKIKKEKKKYYLRLGNGFFFNVFYLKKYIKKIFFKKRYF
jgi:hypothetical protein